MLTNPFLRHQYSLHFVSLKLQILFTINITSIVKNAKGTEYNQISITLKVNGRILEIASQFGSTELIRNIGQLLDYAFDIVSTVISSHTNYKYYAQCITI